MMTISGETQRKPLDGLTRIKSYFRRFLDKIPLGNLLGCTWLLIGLNTYQTLVIEGGLSSLGFIFYSFSILSVTLGFYGLNQQKLKLPSLAHLIAKIGGLKFSVILGSFVLLMDSLVSPVMAQATGGGTPSLLFGPIKNKAAAAISGLNNASLTTFIGVVFGIIEVIVLFYIGRSGVQIFNAVREGEDWQNAARIPLVLVIGIAALNFVVNMV